MRRSHPRASTDRSRGEMPVEPASPRGSRGFAVPLLGLLAVILSGCNGWVGALTMGVLMLASALWLYTFPFPAAGDVVPHLALRAGDGRRALVVGGAGVVSLQLQNRHPTHAFTVHVTPILPPGLVARTPLVRKVVLGPGDRQRAQWQVRVERVGNLVVPGVLLDRQGLFGILRRRLFLATPCRAPVLPDYERSDHPVVARLLRPGLELGERRRRHAVKGAGTDFAELRTYRNGDPLHRVDWKATARRDRLLVREYEEPREFTIRIFLDGSRDLTEGDDKGAAFARAATLVGKLAYLATTRSLGLELRVYDEDVLLAHRMRGSTLDLRRLLAEVVALPRRALVRAVRKNLSSEACETLATACHGRMLGRGAWPGRPGSLEDILAATGVTDGAAYLVDFHPEAVAGLQDRCETCGCPVFPDETGCAVCERTQGPRGLTPRSTCLAGLLLQGLRHARGRETWIVISTFKGGETCEAVTAPLELAVRHRRAVHVVLPAVQPLREIHATRPVSMGSYPDVESSLADAEALHVSAVLTRFTRRLQDAGIAVHPLQDAEAMEEILVGLILDEVLG